MTDSSWITPPDLYDVDVLLLKLQQQEKPALSFEFTIDDTPWRAVLEKHDAGNVTISVILELGALPFSAEANQRRLISTVLIQTLNLHWQQQRQDIQLGLSPRRNTLFLIHKTTRTTLPDVYGVMAEIGRLVLALQGPVRVLKTCTPWLLGIQKKTVSNSRLKR